MNLVLGITGATGAAAAAILIDKSPWPVTLVVSEWGKDVCARENGRITSLTAGAAQVLDDDDLSAAISSGSVPTAGMVILPCTANTLGKIASGIADTLICRAAHCHLKEQRKLVLCIRETPWSLIDLENARRVAAAGACIMPLSPPYYMVDDRPASEVTMADLLEIFADRILSVLGRPARTNWQTRAQEPHRRESDFQKGRPA
ncbi:MAG: UbiX family flavin prenyltransferase [Planctomycetaceae bacterium]|nr:UbiX family flavin prenyltransferase [Planctomycetaceae bacterium]